VNILALETTSVTGSVAAADGTNLLLELDLDPQQRSAQSLTPAMDQLLEQVGWKPHDVSLISVAIGPGSFTGLRVGVTTAKTFAYAINAAIIGVDTLEVIAAGVISFFPPLPPGEGRGEGGREHGKEVYPLPLNLHVAMDAQRGDLVVQSFLLASNGCYQPREDQRLLPAERWLKGLAPGSVITGPVLGRLQTAIPEHLVVLPELLWHPRARHVARLAARYYAAGRRDDLWQLVPRYSRRSAAEEKWGTVPIFVSTKMGLSPLT
jgi:tRNA threonylcarbamoyladenosine biosynthesis protein TsaB